MFNIRLRFLIALLLSVCAASSAAQQSLTFRLPMGETFDMLRVEGGTFLMGSQRDDPQKPNYNPDAAALYNDEGPVHEESVTTFYMARFEVTREVWAAVMGGYVGEDSATVAQGGVKWSDADYFVILANDLLSSQLPQGTAFALPTEQQWEYAARGGTNHDGYIYSGGSSPDDVAQWGGMTTDPARVGQKRPNSLGLYDMSGNVEEWTCSYYTDSYATDATVSYLRRVLRGGSVASRYADLVSVSKRLNSPENIGASYYGVRLVLNLPQGAASGIEEVPVRDRTRAALVQRGGSLLIRGVDGRLTDLSGRLVKD